MGLTTFKKVTEPTKSIKAAIKKLGKKVLKEIQSNPDHDYYLIKGNYGFYVAYDTDVTFFSNMFQNHLESRDIGDIINFAEEYYRCWVENQA